MLCNYIETDGHLLTSVNPIDTHSTSCLHGRRMKYEMRTGGSSWTEFSLAVTGTGQDILFV